MKSFTLVQDSLFTVVWYSLIAEKPKLLKMRKSFVINDDRLKNAYTDYKEKQVSVEQYYQANIIMVKQKFETSNYNY